MAPKSQLEDLIFIQDKIITYKTACEELNVHINTAKQLLHSFVSNPDIKTKVVTTHLIAGFRKDKSHSVVLVKAEDLEKAKRDFECITSEHVYSIQKTTSTPAINELCIADSGALHNRKTFCPIECGKKNVLKAVENITRTIPTPEVPKKPNVFLNAASNKKTASETSQKSSEETDAKKEEKKSSTPEKPKQNKKSETTKEPSRTIGSFFANCRPSSKETAKKQEKVEKEIPKPQEKAEKKRPLEEDKSPEDEPESPKKPHRKEKETKKKGNNKKTQKSKRQKVSHEEPKKRKRIRNMIDTDSDSEGSEEEAEEEAMEIELPLPSPVKEKEATPPPSPHSKKRIRKEIDRTFIDDEGFITTKKEYVYESCSDDEGEKKEKAPEKMEEAGEEPKKKESPEPKSESVKPSKKPEPKPIGGKKSKGKPSPVKNKQASIRNFFSKK